MKKATKLTKLQAKRVAILKDAIAQTKLGAYRVKSGTGYVDQGDYGSDLGGKIDSMRDTAKLFTGVSAKKLELNKYLDRLINEDNPCQVCAKGALLISSIRKFNNFSLEDASHCDLDGSASDKAREMFGKENADLMEEYFEHGHDDDGNNFWYNLSDDERVIRIFKNAIRNKGIFKPEQEKF
jgi:hypothetical protein